MRNRPLFLAVAYFPRDRWSEGASTRTLCLRSSRIDNLDPLSVFYSVTLFLLFSSSCFSVPLQLLARFLAPDVARMHGYLNNHEALSTDTFSLFLSRSPVLLSPSLPPSYSPFHTLSPSRRRDVLHTAAVECLSHSHARRRAPTGGR